MKKTVFFLILCTCLAGCKAKSPEKNTTSNFEQKTENPQYKKIDLVLSKMSQRAQNELCITDKDEFLKDLNAALEAEKEFRNDDVSLYYLIDKKHNIGSSYIPKDLIPLKNNSLYHVSRNDLSLRPDVELGLQKMAEGAKKDGITLLVSSTYRSYDYQARLFQRWVDIDGLEEAERESARPGTSQHQLGQAIDFGNIEDSFIQTSQGKWLNANCEKYGWSLSFPQDYEDITGYRWECWHFRYIGIPACQLQNKWFKDVQQYMFEFIDLWKTVE